MRTTVLASLLPLAVAAPAQDREAADHRARDDDVSGSVEPDLRRPPGPRETEATTEPPDTLAPDLGNMKKDPRHAERIW